MPGGQGAGIRGLQTSDDGIGAELPGEAAWEGALYEVMEGPSERFTGYPLTNPARTGERGSGQKDNGVEKDGGDKPRTFRMKFPEKSGPRPCPVEGFSDQAVMKTAMRVNLWHRHVRDTVVILEEGNLPHPQ